VEPPSRAPADQIWWPFGWRPRARCRLRNRQFDIHLARIANVAGVTGIDLTEPYVEFARARNADQRISFQQADARVLPFEENSFDRAFSMLVLQFIPDAARAVAEMCRVVRPSGTVTAAVSDAYGGNPHTRMIWDISTVLDPSLERPLFRPLSAPNEMANQWRELGLLAPLG
jgi:ubiquinone/menaquinone biosynthesis C-methylase UbiE